ncbi:MAG TPA: sn-glycerol-3-phosphate ABC transporter ATP-binding protein UgpC [Holophaga sp.]|nr:sn-glycerol-3-phosphate ABC transporter ATP-binding protein UgpC [Holophaga sp.]
MATVELKNIAKVFDGKVRAVDGADITIQDKEFVIFVGPSGCGKSTTLRMIAGLEEISEGELRIDGRLVNDVPAKDRDIAMVFQNYALYPHMTVAENMAFGLKMRRIPKGEIEVRVREAARILDIEGLLERRPRQLSGGQRQRVAVGRAIVRHPKVFLFDEPLSNLDAKLRVQMRAELIELHQRLQATMVYVTHDQVEAMTMGDKIVVMKDGRIQQIGSPLYLYNHPINKFVAGFLGTPPMNFLEVKVVEEAGSLLLDEGAFRLPVPCDHAALLRPYAGRTILFGIRPEDLPCDEAGTPAGAIQAKVTLVEPLGADINLYAAAGAHKLTARVAPHHLFKCGETVTFRPFLEKARYFDKDTEASILPAKWDEQAG